MKKEFLKIAKQHYFHVAQYETYRSDFGCQVYQINMFYSDDSKIFSDSIIVGAEGEKENILKRFEAELISFKNQEYL